ncbi:conserved hypothetical protein [Haloferula helveola]|uniref:Flavinylation-associated cytochrome domain-containing protein n=1 Tax=Haloferula helveola TaxID=490095 RepID=A0ABM7R966_9BACT|nr:conserved hypothetical protein [Haloferula helveola]
MRHWVNFGLLFSFLTLMVSGVMAFTRPFSIATTRVHVFFGFLTIVLVVLHLVSRTRYFSGKLKGKQSSRGMVALVAASACGLAALAVGGVWPSKQVIDAGYEARHRAEIVRSSPMAGFLETEDTERFVAREPAEPGSAAVSLLVRFRDGLEQAPAVAVWAETTTGTMIETLYLDESLAYGEEVEWQGVKTRRHRVLPIWRHRYTMVSGIDPNGEVDAFTGSTPSHSFSLDKYLKLAEGEEMVICVEVNAAGDSNEAFPNSEVGQPSLLYTAYLKPEEGAAYALLELTAHGGEAEKGGTLAYDFEGIDSAKRLVDLLLVKVAPAAE